MGRNIKNMIIKNGEVVNEDNFNESLIKNGLTIYEVIRIINGIPLFWEEHLKRLKQSAVKIGAALPGEDKEVYDQLLKLIDINKLQAGNVKIVYDYTEGNPFPASYYYYIPHNYPSPHDYKEGVNTILFYAIRNNPTAKIVDTKLRSKVNEAIKVHQAYEALLVDNENRITEGSRSNIFIIKNNQVYTAPTAGVLPGITRQMVFSLCQKFSIALKEESLHINELPHIQGMFLSGTSPKILPVKKVEDIQLNSASDLIIRQLMKGYDDMVKNYLVQKQTVR